jgi:hypothetical protein
MAVNDIVDLVLLLDRRGGEELEQQAGPEGVSLAGELRELLAARMREGDMYTPLWEEFRAEPESNRAEVIGALEAMVEGDAALAERLNDLLEDFNELALAHGTAWQPPAEEEGQALVGGLRDDVLARSGGEHPDTVRVGRVVRGLPEADTEGADAPDDSRIPTRDDVLALDEMDGLTEGEEALDLAHLDDGMPGADQFDLDAQTDDMGVEDWADMQEEAGMLADDSLATLPGGPLGQVAVAGDGESIGGDAYVHGRLLPDEDIEDDYRPGSLYDSGRDPASTLDRNLAAGVLTAGDIDNALAPVRSALAQQGGALAQQGGALAQQGGALADQDTAGLAGHLDAIAEELARTGSADVNVDRLRGSLETLRTANDDLWHLLAWELLDLLPDFTPAAQRVLRDMGAPF